VLSDLFSNLRADERQALLHVRGPRCLTALLANNFAFQEGAGSNVMSAYVEIHFDNADRRFPVRDCCLFF
jgi:hypothetical protein